MRHTITLDQDDITKAVRKFVLEEVKPPFDVARATVRISSASNGAISAEIISAPPTIVSLSED